MELAMAGNFPDRYVMWDRNVIPTLNRKVGDDSHKDNGPHLPWYKGLIENAML